MACTVVAHVHAATPPPSSPPDMNPDAPPRSTPRYCEVLFHTLAPPARTFNLEVADSPELQARGLMFRRNLAAEQGMLFVFGDDAPRQFWMKNTYISLDIIFLDANRRVVGIVACAEPQTLTERGVAIPSRYVIELACGTAAKSHIEVGQHVSFLTDAKEPR